MKRRFIIEGDDEKPESWELSEAYPAGEGEPGKVAGPGNLGLCCDEMYRRQGLRPTRLQLPRRRVINTQPSNSDECYEWGLSCLARADLKGQVVELGAMLEDNQGYSVHEIVELWHQRYGAEE